MPVFVLSMMCESFLCTVMVTVHRDVDAVRQCTPFKIALHFTQGGCTATTLALVSIKQAK